MRSIVLHKDLFEVLLLSTFVVLVALALFCIAIPFQGLYILLSRMIREYTSSVMVPSSVLVLASRCEFVSYACGITGFHAILCRSVWLHLYRTAWNRILVTIAAC